MKFAFDQMIKVCSFNLTSRDRPKSAPYPRLKNSKKTSKCQVFSFTVLEKRKFSEKNGPSGALKSDNAEKLKGGTLWVFPTSILSQNSKQIEGGPFGEKNFRKKNPRSAEKKLEGGPFGLPGYSMVRGKTGKTFLVQFARPNSAIWCNNIL